jgi:ABC-type sugar transport system ATPase subunit
MNLLPLQLEGERVLVAGRPLQLAEQMRLAARSARGAALVLGIRPEFVRLHGGGGERDDRLTGVVAEIEELGSTRVVFVEVGAQRIAVKLFDEEQAVTPGSTCQIELPAERTILYADGRAVG